MSSGLDISLDLELAGRTAGGGVFAGIELRVGGQTFPTTGWTDFVVVILSALSEASLSLLRGRRGPIEVRLLEGPYAVELSRISRSLWHAALVEIRQERQAHAETDLDPIEFVHHLAAEADRVLSLCRERAWWSQDCDNLQTAVRALQSAW